MILSSFAIISARRGVMGKYFKHFEKL
ncbi:phosphate-starvation-inducible protein PsiE, partial [Listeria monocytogenes]|nr:phosphate-starvation-inducible protein PsiE [Listeria monocytogenes]